MVRTRGNTPQAQVASAAPVAQIQARPRTRSQSIEALSTRTTRTSQSAKPPNARLEEALARTGNTTVSSRGANHEAIRKDLSVLEENDASDAEDQPTAVEPLRSAVSPAANARISISPTTARNTTSSDGDGDGDGDDDYDDDEAGPDSERLLLEIAPDLFNVASRLVKVLTIPNSRTKTTCIEDILLELKNPASITSKMLWTLEQNFDTLYQQFGEKNRFLDPHEIIEAIFEPFDLPAPDSISWGLTELVHCANLAYLGKWVANAQESESNIEGFLVALDKICPRPFLGPIMQGSTFGDSELKDETFQFVLAVRTQIAVTRLKHKFAEDELNPASITQSIRSVFPAQIESGAFSEQGLRAWNLKGIEANASGSIAKYARAIRKTIDALQDAATLDMEATRAGESQFMQTLASSFPWSTFCLKVFNWIHERRQELDVKIRRWGGVATILDTVKQEIGLEATVIELSPKRFDRESVEQRKESPKTQSVMRTERHAEDTTTPEAGSLAQPDIVPPVEGERIPRLKSGFHSSKQSFIKRYSTGREQMASSLQAPNSDPLAQPAAESAVSSVRKSPAGPQDRSQPSLDLLAADDFNPVGDDEDNVREPELRPSQAQSQVEKVTQDNHSKSGREGYRARGQRYSAKRGQDKENRASQSHRRRDFIDSQEEAERIDFDDGVQELQSQQAAVRRPGSISRGKRPAPTDVDEDEDVSQDEGFQSDPRNIGNRSQRRPTSSVAPRSSGHPNQPSPPKHARKPPPTSRLSSSRAPRRPSPGLRFEDDDRPEPTHTQVKLLAARNVAMAKTRAEPRRRKAWTSAEEAKLQDLIVNYGTSWTELKQMDELDGNILADRDQVALKDKARNMKMAFLKARLDLPVNFEYVNLDKKGRDMLDALGIEY